jgi:hypothetical protein
MARQPVSRRQFLGSGIAAAGAISISGGLPATARDWEDYSARFSRWRSKRDFQPSYQTLTRASGGR